MPADCQIDDCGVQAVGRCATCARPFCMSHQAITYGTVFTDRCASCEGARITAERTYEYENGRPFVDSGQARHMLLAAGVPTVEVHTLEPSWRHGLLRRAKEPIWTPNPYGRGWLIGAFRWKYNVGGPSTGSDHDGDCLTVLLDKVYERPAKLHDDGVDSGLARVEADSTNGDYTLLTSCYASFSYASSMGWAGVAARVRELTA